MKKSVEGAFLIAPTFLIGELDAAGAIFPHQEHRCGRWSYNSHFEDSLLIPLDWPTIGSIQETISLG